MPDQKQRTAIVVGAGLGGLAAAIAFRREGWKVQLLESTNAIGEVGAGIQVPPNSSRILISWGLRPALDAIGCRPQEAFSWRFENMEALQSTPFGNTEERYGFPYFHIHRADFHKILLGEAVSPTLSAPCINPGPPVEIITGSPVVSVDCENASVTVEGGKTYSADLLVGCDGVRSVVKRFVTGQSDNGVSSGDQAWRFLIPMERVKEHPDLAFATEHAVNNWWGPNRHIVHYPIRAYTLLNVVAICPDDSTTEESWTATGTKEDVVAAFKDYDPRMLKIFDLCETFNKWKILKRPPLDRWVKGKTCLLGDSCHAMVPYLAQGAAMAVEDAAALAIAVSSNLSIEDALKAYEKVRLPRTTAISAGADNNRNIFHMPDGPGQQARDEMVKKTRGQVSNIFDMAWKYDAVEEMRKEIGTKASI